MGKRKVRIKRNLAQIDSAERAKMQAPRRRGASSPKTRKAKAKAVKTRVVKARYKPANTGYCGAAGFQGDRADGFGFGQTFGRPKLKSLSLVITQQAKQKIQFWLDIADGEFAGFGISGDIKDPLRITDFVLLDQRTGGAHADLDDVAIALHYNDMAKAGLQPVQSGRIWFHTHPFGVNKPSSSPGDDDTFKTAFGDMKWSVMLVFSDNAGAAYAEIQIPSKVLGQSIPNLYELDILYESDVTDAEAAKLSAEFDAHVRKAPRINGGGGKCKRRKKARVKSGAEKLNDALDGVGGEYLLDGDLVDIDALDSEYARQIEEDHDAAVAKIMRRVN